MLIGKIHVDTVNLAIVLKNYKINKYIFEKHFYSTLYTHFKTLTMNKQNSIAQNETLIANTINSRYNC